MDDTVITVENISKRYLLGSGDPYKTLRESIVNLFRKSPRSGTGIAPVVKGDAKSGELWALRDVSFDVRQGDIVGVIGRNGAGKSTLLKILARITEPTTGRISMKGRVGSLLEVGTGFHPELSGHENIYLYGAILGMDRYEVTRKFDEIIAFAELEKFVDTPVKRYSSGMYMRLAFAVAAHLEPEILLVDEVLAVGDVAFQKKCLGKMENVVKGGRTILFVSHNMAAIRKLCAHAILLEKGRIATSGPTEDVISYYLSKSMSEKNAVEQLPDAAPGAPGRGSRLRFFDSQDKPAAQFRIGEKWKIVLEFEITRPVGHVIAAVGITTVDAIPVISFWSVPRDLTPGKYYVAFHCEIPLKSCEIQIGVGLSAFETAFYYVEGVGHVSISEVAMYEQPLRSSGAGLLFSNEKCQIEKLPSNIDSGR
jgi:lipopolysaccharide transport system ATP-binding protein